MKCVSEPAVGGRKANMFIRPLMVKCITRWRPVNIAIWTARKVAVFAQVLQSFHPERSRASEKVGVYAPLADELKGGRRHCEPRPYFAAGHRPGTDATRLYDSPRFGGYDNPVPAQILGLTPPGYTISPRFGGYNWPHDRPASSPGPTPTHCLFLPALAGVSLFIRLLGDILNLPGPGFGAIRATALGFASGQRVAGVGRLPAMNEDTQILSAIEQGEPEAAEKLLPLVYQELRRLAARRLAREAPGRDLQSSDLVHEAYLRLVSEAAQPEWDGRGHFFAAAAEAMRRILVENARRRNRHKHGGGCSRVDLEATDLLAQEPSEDLQALDEALSKLAEEDAAKAEVVKLRFFTGLTMPEIAKVMRISLATAERHWTYARTWLYAELKDRGDTEIS